MKALKTAIIVGATSAALTWFVVFSVVHKSSSGQTHDGILFVIAYPPDDDALTAALWAAGAYFLTFTPALLVLRGRIPRNAFAHR